MRGQRSTHTHTIRGANREKKRREIFLLLIIHYANVYVCKGRSSLIHHGEIRGKERKRALALLYYYAFFFSFSLLFTRKRFFFWWRRRRGSVGFLPGSRLRLIFLKENFTIFEGDPSTVKMRLYIETSSSTLSPTHFTDYLNFNSI